MKNNQHLPRSLKPATAIEPLGLCLPQKSFIIGNVHATGEGRQKMLKMFRGKVINLALAAIKEKVVNPGLEGIGAIKAISYADGEIFLTIALAGLEDRPISIRAGDITIAPDGSSIAAGRFESDILFAQNALDRFLKNRTLEIPEGNARMALKTAKTVLGL